MQKPKRSSTSPAWGHMRIGEYSLEEIALEFILWEDADTRNDAMRKDFINQALAQSFGHEKRAETLHQFLNTFERLYEKIYQRKQGNRVKEDRATPEGMRQLFSPMIEKKAA